MPGIIARWILLAGSLLSAGAFAARDAEIRGIRLSGDANNTRVVIDLSTPVSHTLFTLQNPPRIVLDVHGARIDASRVSSPPGQGPIARVRTANRENGDARVVMDLSTPARPCVSREGRYDQRLPLLTDTQNPEPQSQGVIPCYGTP